MTAATRRHVQDRGESGATGIDDGGDKLHREIVVVLRTPKSMYFQRVQAIETLATQLVIRIYSHVVGRRSATGTKNLAGPPKVLFRHTHA
jgi:hypothetical protein